MGISTESRDVSIHLKQTEQLYHRLIYSAIGTIVAATLMVFILSPRSNAQIAWLWLSALLIVSSYRWVSASIYIRGNHAETPQRDWRMHFNIGTYLSAITWASSIWLFYPEGYPAYQVLMIFGLAGIAGGAISTLSYEKYILVAFLLILLFGIEARLLTLGDPLSYELAALVFIYFMFLVKGGRDIGNSFYELLALRFDNEEHNLTLLHTTERMARIGYWQWDMRSQKIELSANLSNMCGITQKYIDMALWIQNMHKDDRQRVQMAIDSAYKTGEESSIEFRMRNHDKNQWIIMNQMTKRISESSGNEIVLGTVQDISAIKSAEQKIFDMAYYDELTGLANRVHFRTHLIEQLKHASRNQLQLAILYIDLDGFKKINDTLGHDKGDIYLKEFSKRLKSKLREEDFVARLGGDEFCMVMSDIKDELSPMQTAERCLALKLDTISLDNQKIAPQMSIGIAIFPHDGTDADTLLRSADAAMYSAKHKGKHRFAFYDTQMTQDATARLELELELKKALLNNEFHLVYQPKIALDRHKISGVEALIRWHHPSRGIIYPDQFIDTAERIGLINEIGEWVLSNACQQLQEWKSLGLTLDMAVNISSSHFGDDNFLRQIKTAAHQYELEPGELEIEITESMSRDPQKHIHVCRELHRLGIKVAIDDFGTGYSSLSVLKLLEIDTLKVDRAFIQHLPKDESSAMMVTAIINMALGLGFDVVAEGVETHEQADFLGELGCPYVQGYYFGRPTNAEKIPALITQEIMGS